MTFMLRAMNINVCHLSIFLHVFQSILRRAESEKEKEEINVSSDKLMMILLVFAAITFLSRSFCVFTCFTSVRGNL